MKVNVVWRFYLFWLLLGLAPTFSGIQYTVIKDVYKISDVEYSIMSTFTTGAILVSSILYQNFFAHMEVKRLQYWAYGLTLLASFLDLF
jgi:hypothetical protein